MREIAYTTYLSTYLKQSLNFLFLFPLPFVTARVKEKKPEVSKILGL